MRRFTITNLFDLNDSAFIVYKTFRSSLPEVFLIKGVLKIYSKFTEENPC